MADTLSQLRQLMKGKGWNIYLLPRTDEHQSQYLANSDQRVAFISGFSGSNAIALITEKEALLWTDGRYFLQAEKELQAGWQLRKMMKGNMTWYEHVISHYSGATLGVDPRLLTAEAGIKRLDLLVEKGIKVELSIQNLIDQVWTDKPKPEYSEIFLHEEWAGKSAAEKVLWVRHQIKQKQGQSAIFNDLSEIAWILNLRSAQIPFNPFFKGVLIIKLEGGSLYLPKGHPELANKIVQAHLEHIDIKLEPYQPEFGEKALIQKQSLNYYVYNCIKEKEPIEWEGIGLYRAVRTDKEIKGFIRCHIADGVAMAKFWTWRSKFDQIDQYDAAVYMDQCRADQQFNKGPSFETISGGGPNAAVIHYHPTPTNHSLITKNMIHLLDSGGQYLDGTTDVTRTFHFGNPTPEEKDSYTRVLLGNLDIERLRWPAGQLNGGDIDVLARRHLWAKGLDYLHGTGHGIGYFQGVHEGPVAIMKYNNTSYKAGMLVTNEPGYYQPGKYGIRIENVLVVMEEGGFNSFHNITLCPYDKNLLDLSLLTAADKKYINEYHARVWSQISPLLGGDQATLSWLKSATSALP